MSDIKDYFNNNIDSNENFSLREQLEYYFNYWKFILGAALLSLIAAFIYIKYSTPIYQSSTSVLIKKDKSGSLLDASILEEFSLGSSGSGHIDDEIQVMNSIPIVTSVVKELKLNVQIFRKTELTKKSIELYKTAPFDVIQFESDTVHSETIFFAVNIKDSKTFSVEDEDGHKKDYKFGDKILIENKYFTLIPNKRFLKQDKMFFQYTYDVIVDPIDQVVNKYRTILKADVASKTSNVITISLNLNIQEKANDFLNKLVENYIKVAMEDKKEIAINTADFIDERLKVLDQELSSLEKNVESFKIENKLTDIASEAKQFLVGQSEIEKHINENYIQLELIQYMLDYINKNNSGLIPDNIGIKDVTLVSTIQSHNELYLKYKEFLNYNTEDNPIALALVEGINNMRENLQNGLENQKKSLEISLKSYAGIDRNLDSKLREIPKQEREFREINRPQQTKELLYLFLLQKREESKIASISILPNAKVINKANGLRTPVSPKKGITFILFLIMGTLVSIIGIYITKLLNNKIYSLQDLEKISSIPVIGSISRGDIKERKILEKNDRSSIAESFRLLVTNLDFITTNNTGKARSIVVSSTISGEGKSFVSSNLATFLAHSGNKVVLVGLDLRAPKLDEFFTVNSKVGITHFVKDNKITVDDIVFKSDVSNNLDLVFSGLIVPNFMEMTKSKRLKELFESLYTNYDYIIVDSAPIGLASDTLMFSNFADLCLYVVRADYLDKRLIDVSEILKRENRFKNITLLLNDVDM